MQCRSKHGSIFNARRYDDAEAQARKTLEMDSRFICRALLSRRSACNLRDELKEAIAEYQKAVELNNDPYSHRHARPGLCPQWTNG